MSKQYHVKHKCAKLLHFAVIILYPIAHLCIINSIEGAT